MTADETMRDEVRRVVGEHARLSVDIGALGDGDDLFGAGMTSHASVRLMLALEDAFEVEFPDEMLKKATFESVAAIEAALNELRSVPA
jgi:acyl carrier protein